MIRLALPFAALLLTGAAADRVVRYALPEEAAAALPPGPGAEAVQASCVACHSFDYVTTQPRGKGAKFWGDEVTKMVAKYGAVVPETDRPAIVAYLAKHY
jgi:mono/diheme cytochrome c family protein